jgi:hypothetical protein
MYHQWMKQLLLRSYHRGDPLSAMLRFMENPCTAGVRSFPLRYAAPDAEFRSVRTIKSEPAIRIVQRLVGARLQVPCEQHVVKMCTYEIAKFVVDASVGAHARRRRFDEPAYPRKLI